MKLLLHTCCAPCSVYCIKSLRAEGVEPTLYWYNPNIHPYAEYKARRDCLKKYAEIVGVELIIDDAYGLDEFCCQVANRLETRCETYCYPLRLQRAAQYAFDHGFDAISTTLLYSIYQKHDIIKQLLSEYAVTQGIEFLYRDFRAGWQEGQDAARQIGLYMQKYCGCVFSEEESGFGRELGRKMQKRGLSPTNANVRRIIEVNKSDDGFVVPAQLRQSLS
ncbi:epoxyqueuosine reductase QueH [Candidatus Saccharibacteria bacterium]|nr:epoxyqueuosine reductase QueH [Candidatus Saccharibacteria bacterium]